MSEFAGVKVLIVEDEGAVAMMIEDMLEALGCEIILSTASLAKAEEIAAKGGIDVAVLDVNVGGKFVFPVAQTLRERQIPFLFSTGYGAGGLPSEYANHQVLGKPFTDRELQQKLTLTLQGVGR